MTQGLVLPFVILCAVSCSGEVKYNRVPITGLQSCGADQYYKHPLYVEMTTAGATQNTVVTNSKDQRVSIQDDKTTTWVVRAGVCQNELSQAPFLCTVPSTFYHQAKFTYDPKKPMPLTIPSPKTQSTCVSL